MLQENGTYKKETFIQDFDDGVRDTTTKEGLAKLRAVFAVNGSVTAGNSSQTTDGAAATMIASGDAVKKYGLKPIAKLKMYTTVGCEPDEMGVGPAVAIPKLLNLASMKTSDIGLWEINEAFASQALYSIRTIGIEDQMDRININGGAIALGHPLGLYRCQAVCHAAGQHAAQRCEVWCGVHVHRRRHGCRRAVRTVRLNRDGERIPPLVLRSAGRVHYLMGCRAKKVARRGGLFSFGVCISENLVLKAYYL